MAVIVPTVESVGDEALTNSIIDKSITELQDTTITTLGTHALRKCVNLKKVVLGAVTTVNGEYTLRECTALEYADFHKSITLCSSMFQGCTALNALILRGETLCPMAYTSALSSSAISSGTGYVYVPRALVDSYKTATNWRTYASQIRAIEDYPEVCSDLGKVWTRCTDDGKSFKHVAYANGVWVALAYGIYYSLDGVTWKKSISTSFVPSQLFYANGIWIVTGSSLKCIYVSTDGMSWTKVSTDYPIRVAFGNGVFVGTTAPTGLLYSTDGFEWQKSSITSGTIRDVVYADGYFLATAASNYVYKSVDGVTWDTFDFPGGSINGDLLAYGNGVFVLPGLLSGTYSMYFSGDGGETWTRSPQSFGTPQRVYFCNGLFFVGGTGGGVWVSSDGENWEKTVLTDAYISFVQYDNGIWLTSVNSKMHYSYDGLEWVEATPSFNAYAAAFDGSKWVAASSAGLYYSE